MSMRPGVLLLVCAIAAAWPVTGTAQVIGTFSWQTQPYCNVITVQVVQQGPLYQLIGTDNLCGAGTAPVTGTAVPAGGSVVFGMTAALPSGRAAHLSASVSLATISGSWSDTDGNAGTFAFNGNAAGGARPTPASATAITVSQFAPTVYAGTGAAATVARSDHDHDTRYYTRSEIDASKIPEVVTTGDTFAGLTYLPEGQTFQSQTVSTTRAGRLLLSKMFTGFASCTNPGDQRAFFIVLDGVGVRATAIYDNSGAQMVTRLSGVTAGVVPAGSHTVSIGVECIGSSTSLGVGGILISNLSIIVLP